MEASFLGIHYRFSLLIRRLVSAFVGLGAIFIGIPVPAYLGQLIVKAQKDKMARVSACQVHYLFRASIRSCQTDKRVQSVTESTYLL